MAKILFISICDKAALGIRYLSGMLKQKGHDTNILFFKEYNQMPKKNIKEQILGEWHEGINQFGEEFIFSYASKITKKEASLMHVLIGRLNPDLVGFSLNSCHMPYAQKLVQEIKSKFNMPIVFGGAGPTLQPEEAIKYADIVCIGEGEEAMLELVGSIDKRINFSNIKNLWVRQGNRIIKNTLRPLIQNLDSLLSPDFTSNNWRISKNKLLKDTSYNNFQGVYIITASRGCPFQCSYCCNDYYKKLYSGQKYVRLRSAKDVINELISAKKVLNPKFVMFYDEIFITNKAWLAEFIPLYQKCINLPFWCNIHPHLVDFDVLARLKSCGLTKATLGIQSGSEDIRKEWYNRNTPNKKIVQTANYLKQLKIRCLVDIITNCYFEKEQDCKATLNLLLQLQRPFSLALSKLSIFPKSSLETKTRLQYQKIPAEITNYYNQLYYIASFSFIPKWITRWLSLNSFCKKNPEIFKTPFMFRKIFVIAKTILKS